MNFGKSKAKFQMEPNTGITFADVAGVEEAKADFMEVCITVSMLNGLLLVCLPGWHQAESAYKHGVCTITSLVKFRVHELVQHCLCCLYYWGQSPV